MPKNIMGTTLSTTYHGSSGHKLIGPGGQLYQPVETITISSSGACTPSTLTPYGIAYARTTGGGVAWTSNSSNGAAVFLPAPMIGVRKTIILETTAAGSHFNICLSTGSSDAKGGALLGSTTLTSTGAAWICFSSLTNGIQGITLVGLTTEIWAVESIFSTLMFNNAAGIRYSTVPNTTA